LLKYIKEINLSISDELFGRFETARPAWAKVGTFVECESWDFDVDLDDAIRQPSLEEVKVDGTIYRGNFSYPDSEQLSEKFWVVYKPDFYINTWDDKPGELSQSAMVLVNVIEIIETSEASRNKNSYIRLSVDRVIPFQEIATYFEPSYDKNPVHGFHGWTEKNKYAYWDGYFREIDNDLILIEAGGQGDVSAWFVCQKRAECEAPVVILYSHYLISKLFTFFGNCPLTKKQWEEIDLYCR
jgi:hypothetical protein